MKQENIIKHEHAVKRDSREENAGHKGAVVWITGLSGSGKSTIANRLETRLWKMGCRTYILDGDNIRMGLNKDLGFSDEDRKENIRRISEVASLFADSAAIVITAFISPFEADRQYARSLVDNGRFIEVYAKCPINICEERDPKNLYKKARKGSIKDFTGIASSYEEPGAPEIIIETHKLSVEESVEKIIRKLYELNIIKNNKV